MSKEVVVYELRKDFVVYIPGPLKAVFLKGIRDGFDWDVCPKFNQNIPQNDEDNTEEARYQKRELAYKNFKAHTRQQIRNNFKKTKRGKFKTSKQTLQEMSHRESEQEKMVLDGRQHFIKEFLQASDLAFVKEDDFSWNNFCDGALDSTFKRRGIESKYVNWDNTKE
jgi:hypothetical protein